MQKLQLFSVCWICDVFVCTKIEEFLFKGNKKFVLEWNNSIIIFLFIWTVGFLEREFVTNHFNHSKEHFDKIKANNFAWIVARTRIYFNNPGMISDSGRNGGKIVIKYQIKFVLSMLLNLNGKGKIFELLRLRLFKLLTKRGFNKFDIQKLRTKIFLIVIGYKR